MRQTNSTYDIETAHESNINSDNAVVNYSATHDPTAILTTALIDVLDDNGYAHEACALLNNCSTSNFMKTELSKNLNLREIHAQFDRRFPRKGIAIVAQGYNSHTVKA